MNTERAKAVVRGAVQGVGFRPFVYRLARELGLRGWVLNSSEGVFIEIEGPRPMVHKFLLRVEQEKPPRAFIQSLEFSFLDPAGYEEFEIRDCPGTGKKTALILPDIATCPECLREIFDPHDRRCGYPFTNCTNCGPRFTIVESLPYDRANTTMKKFKMCPECESEYRDPENRRFHAQPNGCPNCGPHLELWNDAGGVLALRHEALRAAANAVREGRVLALKGIGGFQLVVNALDDEAVRRLRERKHREEKPFALMYPSLDRVKSDCLVGEFEERLLRSPESPIVVLERRGSEISNLQHEISVAVAPRNPALGVMLPYSPLHHLFMRELGFPIVATSANLSDEPICIDEFEALARLRGLADLFLVHDRPIARHVDDSVVRVMLGRELVMRRARGYAPLPINVQPAARRQNHEPAGHPKILAVGAHLKNTIALSLGHNVFLSQHIGDLETQPAYEAFCKVAADFEELYGTIPDVVACDLHPDYLSTKFAQRMGRSLVQVQHHYAHVLACMAENELEPPVHGVSWDGTGLGLDGTIWGGEFLLVSDASFERVAHLRTFRLPGGDAAVRQPRRSALGVLHEVFGAEELDHRDLDLFRSFADGELPVLRKMLKQGVNAPLTSSAGRLFDAVSALIGLHTRAQFEGQAATELEFAIAKVSTDESYKMPIKPPRVVDWAPMILELLGDVQQGVATGIISAKFHNALAEAIVEVSKRVGEPKVVLTGGCFQNKYLTERTVRRLCEEGFRPYWHQRIPPNDGGIALGQVMAAFSEERRKPTESIRTVRTTDERVPTP